MERGNSWTWVWQINILHYFFKKILQKKKYLISNAFSSVFRLEKCDIIRDGFIIRFSECTFPTIKLQRYFFSVLPLFHKYLERLEDNLKCIWFDGKMRGLNEMFPEQIISSKSRWHIIFFVEPFGPKPLLEPFIPKW